MKIHKLTTLEDIKEEAFATEREAAFRVIGEKPYYVQILGGLAIHYGNIAEMKTGEGKTLTSTMPAYLNALSGHGVHIITVNEYLAGRDAEWMGNIYRFLGLTVGVNYRGLTPQEKRDVYQCDIMYSTNNEIGFDYLRDNMVVNAKDRVQRPLHYAIIDEVDSVLIDEARTPLIISGGFMKSANLYRDTDKFVKRVLTNTIYVKCDTKIYTYYKEKGYIMYNDLNDFNGKCGAVIYGKEKGKKNRIRTEIDEQLFVLVKNIPVIESKNFIIVQEKINSNKKEITAKKRGKYSWLTGLVKCKLCNSSVGVKVTRGYKYMICSKHRLYNACDNKRNYKLEEIEDIIYKEVVDYIKDIDVNNLIQDDEKNAYKSKENELLIKKTQYQEKLNNLISIASNNKEIEDILKENIIKLGESIQKIEENIENIKMDALNREIDVDMYIKAIDIITNRFSELDLYEKNRLVKIFVKCIYLNEKEIEILFYI